MRVAAFNSAALMGIRNGLALRRFAGVGNYHHGALPRVVGAVGRWGGPARDPLPNTSVPFR